MYTIKVKKTILVLALLLTSALNSSLFGLAASPVFTTSTYNSGGAVTTTYDSKDAVHLTAPSQAGWDSVGNVGTGVNEGRIEIALPDGFTLGDLESISWEVWTVAGYPPHVDLLLDMDGNGVFDGGKKDMEDGGVHTGVDDALVFEFAYQPYDDSGYSYTSPGVPYGHYDPATQSSFYNPTTGEWLNTFQKTSGELNTGEVTDSSIAWLYSGLPGPYTGGYFGTLSDFKDGTVSSIDTGLSSVVNSDTKVLALQIEVDNWLGPADAYVATIAVIGYPQITVISPEPITYGTGDIALEIEAMDVMGIKSVTYSLEKTGEATPIIVDQPYSAPTTLTGLTNGEYTLTAAATNDNDYKSEETVTFNVFSVASVDIHPETLNLRSGGRWVTVKISLPEGMSAEEFDIETVRLRVNGEALEPEWGKICEDEEDHSVMLKFSRAELIEALEGLSLEPEEGDKFLDVEVTVKVTGDLPGGGDFEHTDTIRVICPGNGKMFSQQTLNRGQTKKLERGPKGNKGPKDPKPGKGPKSNNGNGKNKGNK